MYSFFLFLFFLITDEVPRIGKPDLNEKAFFLLVLHVLNRNTVLLFATNVDIIFNPQPGLVKRFFQ